MKTAMFMLKQHQGAALTARRYHIRRREMGLMAITHNIMIVRSAELFYRAYLSRFLPEPSFGIARQVRLLSNGRPWSH